jgi:predicted ATPase/class 3 adenylate cyclase
MTPLGNNANLPLPTGTITLLFTDIEGSTNLLHQLGDQYANVLAQQRDLLREAFEKWNGRVVDTQGDAFFVAFSSAMDAVNAAVASQRALSSHQWPEQTTVRVRMALHTGELKLTATGFVGIDVHRAARLCAAAYGGQTIISQTTRDLVESELPEDVSLRDLGEHRLKDLQRLRIYQLVIPGLPADFPPLQTLDAHPNNLPLQLTSFIGREREIREVKQMLLSTRLLTLTGPGGSGKTRLALQVAAESIEQFRDGVFFVALAPITEPGLVASTIAQALGVAESGGRSVLDSLKDYLRAKHLLLFLDNFEQVISATPHLVEMLAACSHLTILVTSREGLRVRGEQEYPVSPLALPDLTELPPVESLRQFAAVELFIQRAQAIKPDFDLTNETAPDVAAICYRLDGVPLAIELAAARIKLLPPRAMLKRLEHQLEFLTGGARDLPARQQTLRNAIAWSYDLLDENGQRFFRRLSVFVGGCTLDAAEAVAKDKGEGERGAEQGQDSVLDQLSSLLDKSLLREVEGANGEPRFVMLEMLREFGGEQLAGSGEQETIRRRHAGFFLALAEASLESMEQVQGMNRLEQEHDNLRAALEWSKRAEGAGELCLRLAGTLGLFWEVRGYFSEGRERLSAVLAMELAQGRTAARAKLLARAAELAFRQSDYSATQALAGESLAICREIGDKRGVASALIKLGNAATESGDYATAPGYLEDALTIWRELGDKHGTARALINLGWVALRLGDNPLANTRLEEALALSRELGDTRGIGFALSGLGEAAARQGAYARATQLVEESLELRRQIGNKWGVGVSLGTLGWIALRKGDWNRAGARLGESLAVRREIGDQSGSAWCLERLAELAMARGQAEKAVRVFGAATAQRESIGSVMDPVDQPESERQLAALRAQLGEERFAAAWAEGRALTMDQAIEYGLGNGKFDH